MPNRILKESICTSDNLDLLDAETERFFYRLMVQADDFGRMDARPAILRARCFPLRLDTVSEEQIQAWIEELVMNGLIRIYKVDGHPFLQFITWEKHQQKRARYSKYPEPPAPKVPQVPPPADEGKPDDVISDDINCKQVIAYVSEKRESRNEKREGAQQPLADAGSRSVDPDFGEVCNAYEQNITLLTPMASDMLQLDYTEYGKQYCLDAIGECVRQGKRKWSYAQGIMRRWRSDGHESLPGGNGARASPSVPVTIILPDGQVVEAKT